MSYNNSTEPTPLEPLCVSVKQALALIPLGQTALYEAMNDGRLESSLVNGKRFINFKSLKRFAGVA